MNIVTEVKTLTPLSDWLTKAPVGTIFGYVHEGVVKSLYTKVEVDSVAFVATSLANAPTRLVYSISEFRVDPAKYKPVSITTIAVKVIERD